MDYFSPDKIEFKKENGTLLLSINAEHISIPDSVLVAATARGLAPKDEYHITIFGFDFGKRILDYLGKLSADQRNALLVSLSKLIQETKWNISFRPEWYRIAKTYAARSGVPGSTERRREAIICMVEVPELAGFVTDFEKLISLHFSAPPTHVTLFSKSSQPDDMLSGIGVSSSDELRKLNPVPLGSLDVGKDFDSYTKIALPTRPQPDTLIAIFILKHFGSKLFPGIDAAPCIVMPLLPEGETEESLRQKGIFFLDVGGGMFDHHNKPFQVTVSQLVSRYLEVDGNAALGRLLQLAERDDFLGKGTISIDPLDRAFGLPGLIAVLNKDFVKNPEKVVDVILPILFAFFHEEERRAFELPKELEEKIKNGKAYSFEVRQRGKSLKCMYIETDNTSMAGYIRAHAGGSFDVVAVRLSSGHVNILTRQAKQVDLRSLVVLIRMQEAEARGITLDAQAKELAVPGTLQSVPQWHYDTATNSLFNGGPNPVSIQPTKIDPFELKKLLEIGLSEKLWSPSN